MARSSVHFTSLSLSHRRSLHHPPRPPLPLFIRALVARQIGECAGSFCEIPAYIVLSRLINASMDSIFYVIHSDCFVLHKNTKWARLDLLQRQLKGQYRVPVSLVIFFFRASFFPFFFALTRQFGRYSIASRVENGGDKNILNPLLARNILGAIR